MPRMLQIQNIIWQRSPLKNRFLHHLPRVYAMREMKIPLHVPSLMAVVDRGGGWDGRSEAVIVVFPVVDGEEAGYNIGVVAFRCFPGDGEIVEYTAASKRGFCRISASPVTTCVCEFVWWRKSLSIGSNVERSGFWRKDDEDEFENKYCGRKYEHARFQESSVWGIL